MQVVRGLVGVVALMGAGLILGMLFAISTLEIYEVSARPGWRWYWTAPTVVYICNIFVLTGLGLWGTWPRKT